MCGPRCFQSPKTVAIRSAVITCGMWQETIETRSEQTQYGNEQHLNLERHFVMPIKQFELTVRGELAENNFWVSFNYCDYQWLPRRSMSDLTTCYLAVAQVIK